MADVYAATVQAIVSVTSIDAAEITPDKHIFDDLQIDSLDFLDITFEIDRMLGVKLPVEDWLAGSNASDAKLVMKNFVAFVSGIAAQEATTAA